MDPIANMLVSIRNAQAVHKETVDVPYSVIKHTIADILVSKKFIESVEKKERKSQKTNPYAHLKVRPRRTGRNFIYETSQ